MAGFRPEPDPKSGTALVFKIVNGNIHRTVANDFIKLQSVTRGNRRNSCNLKFDTFYTYRLILRLQSSFRLIHSTQVTQHCHAGLPYMLYNHNGQINLQMKHNQITPLMISDSFSHIR